MATGNQTTRLSLRARIRGQPKLLPSATWKKIAALAAELESPKEP